MSELTMDLDRDTLVRLALDTCALVSKMPSFWVELDDLPKWVELLGVDTLMLRLRDDGRVSVDTGEFHRGQYVTVHCVVDVVRDLELPPAEKRESVRFPVSGLGRLELLKAVTT